MIQNTLNVEQSRRLLKALADPIRLDVIHALAQGERCVCELTGELTDAPFALRQRMDHVEADGVGQCFKQPPRLFDIEGVLDHKNRAARSAWININ